MVDTQKHNSLSFQNTFKLGFKTDYTPINNVIVKYNRLRGKKGRAFTNCISPQSGAFSRDLQDKSQSPRYSSGVGAVVTIY